MAGKLVLGAQLVLRAQDLDLSPHEPVYIMGFLTAWWLQGQVTGETESQEEAFIPFYDLALTVTQPVASTLYVVRCSQRPAGFLGKGHRLYVIVRKPHDIRHIVKSSLTLENAVGWSC